VGVAADDLGGLQFEVFGQTLVPMLNGTRHRDGRAADALPRDPGLALDASRRVDERGCSRAVVAFA
jgi:hypothetical protein